MIVGLVFIYIQRYSSCLHCNVQHMNFVNFCFSTKDVKEKLGFLRRRHTDTSLAAKLGDSSSDSMGAEKILSWGKGFDNLLQDKGMSKEEIMMII